MIAWRFIITDFYQLQYNPEMPPYDIVRAYSIYTRTLERYTHLVMAKAHRTRTILLARQRSDNPPSTRMVRRTNKTIAPLFFLDEEAVLTKTQMMERRLAKQKLNKLENISPQQANNHTQNTEKRMGAPSAPAESWSSQPSPRQIYIAHSPLRGKMRIMQT
jgi:hypothetical protein